jgi:hypothetical protein
MRAEFLAGGKPALEPIDRPWDFANNDLGFKGEKAYDEFDGPLASNLEAWMAGEGLDSPESAQIEKLIELAEVSLSEEKKNLSGRAAWIAGLPLLREESGGVCRLAWTYRGEARELRLPRAQAKLAHEALIKLGTTTGQSAIGTLVAAVGGQGEAIDILRESGLVLL